jgi:hypothetical protein
MRTLTTIAGAVCLILSTQVLDAQVPAEVSLSAPDGASVSWSARLEARGPCAVLLWGSWLPESDSVLAEVPDLQRIASERGLDLVVVAIQEPREVSRSALGNLGVSWLHDRHGSMLKVLQVFEVPRLVVVADDGTVRARIEPSAGALAGLGDR